MLKTNSISRKKVPFIFLYGVFYATIVAIFTFLFTYMPKAVELEDSLYDRIQKYFTIDSKNNIFYKKYEKYFNDFIFVNIDSTFFHKESNKVDRRKLANFIDLISNYQDSLKCILLDYEFISPLKGDSINVDSLLTLSLTKLKSKLILPYSFSLKGKLAHRIKTNIITKNDIVKIDKLLFNGSHKGFHILFSNAGSDVVRYIKIKTDDSSHYSITYKFLELTYKHINFINFVEVVPNNFLEINYLLKNDGFPRAIPIYQINDLLQEYKSNLQFIKKLLHDKKIMVVSVFDDYKTVYGTDINKIKTPIKQKLNGSLIYINAYLNLINQNFLIRGSILWVFLINLLIGCTSGISLLTQETSKKFYKKFLARFTKKLVVSLIFFNILTIIVFFYFNTKLSLSISFLIFQKDETIYELFLKLFNTFKK